MKATMRVLWFTITPLEAVNRRFNRPTTGSGFWMHSLVQPLLRSGGVNLAVATATPAIPEHQFEEDGVEYFGIAQQKTLRRFDLFREHRRQRYLEQAMRIVDRWKPDLIHVHGTEQFYGLVRARKMTVVPTVVSIQGVIEECYRVAWGAMSFREVISCTGPYDLIRNYHPFEIARRFRRQIPVEREILQGIDAVIGRTDWDRAHVRSINPHVSYCHVEEMIRSEFRTGLPWALDDVQRGLLMTTSGLQPLKGLPVLLKALAILRSWGHDVRLKVAGTEISRKSRNGLAKHLMKQIGRLGLEEAVQLLGWLDAEQLAQHMRSAHCFVTPSLIENSCNALSEAQMMGLPCVATHAGGLTTMIEDGRTGLLYSSGDAAMLANHIEQVLLDDDLARDMGMSARGRAQQRHDPEAIVRDLLNCYRSVTTVAQAEPAMAAQEHVAQSRCE